MSRQLGTVVRDLFRYRECTRARDCHCEKTKKWKRLARRDRTPRDDSRRPRDVRAFIQANSTTPGLLTPATDARCFPMLDDDRSINARNEKLPDQRENTLGQRIARNETGRESRLLATLPLAHSPRFSLPYFFLARRVERQRRHVRRPNVQTPLFPSLRYHAVEIRERSQTRARTHVHGRGRSRRGDARYGKRYTRLTRTSEAITRRDSDNGARHAAPPPHTTSWSHLPPPRHHVGPQSRSAIGRSEPRELFVSSPSASMRVPLLPFPRTTAYLTYHRSRVG